MKNTHSTSHRQLHLEAGALGEVSVTALSLRTTGADPARGDPIALTAVTYDKCGNRDPYHYVCAADAPADDAFAVALEKALGMSAGGWCVTFGSWVPARIPSTSAWRASSGWLLDIGELAAMAWPSAMVGSLAALAEMAGHTVGEHETGECDAMLAVFEAAVHKISQLPAAALFEMSRILEPCHGAWERTLLLAIENTVSMTGHGTAGADGGDAGSFYGLLRRVVYPEPRRRPVFDEAALQAVSQDEVAAFFGAGGTLAQLSASYEIREGQVAMGRHVADALSDGHHLLVEAGTGTGKSLAYLLPAALWALRNEQPVVVSTNTKNLQSQLFEKDLPLVERAIGRSVRAALLKGRGNYVCSRRVFQLLNHAGTELDRAERILLAPVLVWLLETGNGDLSELSLWGRKGGVAFALCLGSNSEECAGRACNFFRSCYFRKARAEANAADIIVANHSLVFADRSANAGGAARIPPHCVR